MKIPDPRETMIRSLQDSCGLNAYRKTLNLDANIAADISYQKNFTNYYRVRRDAAWLQEYYRYFEENKHNKNISFEEILRHLSNIEHRVPVTAKNRTGKAKTVEASFASKMLATINPDHPIWDSQVLRFLNKKVHDTLQHAAKIETCISLYADMEHEIADFIQTDSGQTCIALFDEAFPYCSDFSDYKKIDFYLWNLGK